MGHGGAPGDASGAGERMWVTCSADGHDHAVDERLLARGGGRFPAVCGHLVLAASLAAPPGTACPVCLAVVRSPGRASRRRGRHAAVGPADDRG